MSTTFHTPKNGVSTTVASARSLGGTTIAVAAGTGSRFGSTFPLIVTAARSGSVLAIFNVTGRSGDDLTIAASPIEGTSDVALEVDDVLEMRPTALAITEIHTAILALESGSIELPIELEDVNGLTASLSIKAQDSTVVHNFGAETIAGTKTFSANIIGTLAGNCTGNATNVTGTVALANGGTGATTAANARTNLGLGTLATQSGTFSGTSSGTNTGDQTVTLTGDVTGSGTGSFAATLASTAVTPGSYTATNLTVDAKGRITAAANGSAGGVSIGDAITGATAGRVPYWGAGTPGVLTDDADLTFNGTRLVGLGMVSPAHLQFDVPNGGFATSFGHGFVNVYNSYSSATFASFNVDNYQLGAVATYLMDLTRHPSGTTPYVRLSGIDSAASYCHLAYIDAGFSLDTHGSHTGYLRLCAQDFGAASGGREGIRIDSDGTQALIGFFGATPVAKAAAPTLLSDVIAILQNLGLCS